MSLSNNFPTIRPTLLLDFANSNRLDPRVTFTRASTATYYDGVTTAKAEENLVTYSQPLNVGWVKFGTATITDNNAVAPDGATAAALISSPATGDYAYQAPNTNIGQIYVFSVYVKNSTATISRLWVRTSSTAADILLNWSGATLSSVTQTTGTATFTAVGNDWYRVVVTYTAVETAARLRIYGGDGTSTTGNILVWGVQLEQRSSVTAYTATTTQAITNYIPVLQTAQSNVPRFDHNPITSASLGLLIEEQRTNIEPNSEALTSVTGSSILNNVTIAPSGLVTADRLVEDTSTGGHQVNTISITWAGNTAYTFTIFLKADTRNQVNLAFGTAGNWVGSQRSAQFDLSNGTVIGTGGANVTASIEAVGNGWYRCRITCTTIATPVPSTVQTQMWVGGSATYTGDGTSGLFFWGAQVEVGSFPTSYIPTSGTTLTRNADVATMTGTNFSSWYNQTEGSLFAEYAIPFDSSASLFPVIVGVSDGTFNNVIINYARTVDDTRRATVRVSGASPFDVSNGVAYTYGTTSKQILAYATNNAALSVVGTAPATVASTSIPTVNQMGFGNNSFTGGGLQPLNGWLRRVAYYPTRLPNATLQALTA